MAKWGIPEGRKPLTDADMAELTRRLADTAIEQSELYKAAKRDAEKAEAYAAELEAVIARLTALLQKQSTLMDMGFAEYERRLATARRDALDDAAQTVESLWACRTCAEVAEAVRALITKEEPTT